VIAWLGQAMAEARDNGGQGGRADEPLRGEGYRHPARPRPRDDEEWVVELVGVTKRYRRRQVALDDVSLQVPRGRVVGLLGGNGAGKTTLLRHLMGMVLPTTGDVRVLGVPARALAPQDLARIGYVDQETEPPGWLTAGRFLRFVASHYPRWNARLVDRLAGELGVDLAARLGVMSVGKRQLVTLVAAMGHEPELLLLDEPASAMDPLARARFLELVRAVAADRRRTVIVSSHILSDVERVVDDVVLLRDGRVAAHEPLSVLRDRWQSPHPDAPPPDLETIFRAELAPAERTSPPT